jgi:beta-glucosidase
MASHQSEGGNHNSWTEWEDVPGHIKNGEKSGLADDHWNRFEEDFDNLVWLNANTHRFSVEWSRLEPQQGQWNDEAALHYREMIMALKKRNIRPVICLFHFTLPIWVAEKGGFENPEVMDAFVAFSEKAQRTFGDLVEDWLTLNEPVVYALGGYAAGVTPPGVKDFKRTMNVVVNMLKVHGRVYHALKILDPQARVSFAQHLRVFTPKNKFSPFDRWGAHVADEVMNWSWYKTIQTGKIKIHIPLMFSADEECPECLGAMDYIGFNYYSHDLISVNPFTAQKFFLSTRKNVPTTDMGWEIYPEGMVKLLKEIKSHGLAAYPLLVTENGIADAGDTQRPQFIYDHLRLFLQTAEDLGLKPMGYLYWSLIDNFEWVDGFGPRFGLFSVDYATQKRTPRPSAYFFKEMGARREVFPPQ